MSVVTRADECHRRVDEGLKMAINNLSEMLNEDTWGSEDFNKEFITASENLLVALITAKQKWKS